MSKRALAQDIPLLLQNSQTLFIELQEDSEGFAVLSELLRQLAGIHLLDNSKNRCLMASRLLSVLKKRGIHDYGAYAKLVKTMNPEIITEFISALTTNTTQFFREEKHFNVLRESLPQILQRKVASGKREIRIWCGATSTGQEAYTIAMTILEALNGAKGWEIKFLATDIDLEVLARAAAGIYNESEMAHVPPLYKQKYFRSLDSANRQYEIDPRIREMIRFAQFNLIAEKYPFQFPFDVIFCRNVLIYFGQATAWQVVQLLAGALAPGGFLFLGHSESGAMKSPLMPTVAHAVYKKGEK